MLTVIQHSTQRWFFNSSYSRNLSANEFLSLRIVVHLLFLFTVFIFYYYMSEQKICQYTFEMNYKNFLKCNFTAVMWLIGLHFMKFEV